MNQLLLSGTLVRRTGPDDRHTQRIVLEVYNPDIGDVLRCVAYGPQGIAAVPVELQAGAQVEIQGRVSTLHWRAPKSGNRVQEMNIEIVRVAVMETAPAGVFAIETGVAAGVQERGPGSRSPAPACRSEAMERS